MLLRCLASFELAVHSRPVRTTVTDYAVKYMSHLQPGVLYTIMYVVIKMLSSGEVNFVYQRSQKRSQVHMARVTTNKVVPHLVYLIHWQL